MKTTVAFGMVLLSTLLAHARLQDSYTLLAGIARLENNLLCFGNSRILDQRYGSREIYRKKMRLALDRFEHAMRPVAIDMKGADEQKLLARFVDARQRMQEALSSRDSALSALTVYSESYREIVREAARLSRSRAAALSPQQQHRLLLINMEKLLAEITQIYLLKSMPDTKALDGRIAAFEQSLRSCRQYSAGVVVEKEALARIARTWDVLKSCLNQPGLDLIVELGAAGTASLVRSLRTSFESDG